MRLRMLLLALAALMTVAAVPASAHEFVVKPVKAAVKAGEKLTLSALSAHVFMVSEELEDPANVKIKAVDAAGTSSEVAVTANKATLAYDGQTSFAKPGYGMLLGHRLPEVWTKTPEGMKKGTKADFPGATVSNLYEKFCKTLIVVDKADDGWKKSAGHKLEIMPLADPAGYKAGQEAAFQILVDGKPQSAEVFATCDGYTKTPNSYGWYTETDDKGVAQVKFSQKGLWMVRVQHKAPGKDGITEHVMRSVLVFAVN
ncbi:DUF4198 domain-containing protein [Fundidesulfovibrio putealis]|uniref:DUF4198 domain-containing protein n=1 Tax=Fundidesulfovibrio putealis TaxID=270496 RepID=UPI0004857891|nr:DUF4198 domain-containing protein [Fundidesulfovibrio putealis]